MSPAAPSGEARPVRQPRRAIPPARRRDGLRRPLTLVSVRGIVASCLRPLARLPHAAAWLACAAGALPVVPLADTAPPPAAAARIAIIIDDLGYGLAQARRVVGLPGPVACAVLPETPHAARTAALAHAAGKPVLLHLPLQSIDGIAEAAEALTLDSTRGEVARLFARHLAAVPHASGVNNHMGSLITRHPGHMRWLMQEIKAREALYFVDSYTTRHSVAIEAARELGVPALRRDVFLDDEAEPAAVAAEFARLKALARRRGAALAIGHPFPATLELLERELPRLSAQGIALVSPGSLIEAGEASRWSDPSSLQPLGY